MSIDKITRAAQYEVGDEIWYEPEPGLRYKGIIIEVVSSIDGWVYVADMEPRYWRATFANPYPDRACFFGAHVERICLSERICLRG